jgi:hypothetical protein
VCGLPVPPSAVIVTVAVSMVRSYRKEEISEDKRNDKMRKEMRRNHHYVATISVHNTVFGYYNHSHYMHTHTHAYTHTYVHIHVDKHTHKYIPLLCCAISSPLLCREI